MKKMRMREHSLKIELYTLFIVIVLNDCVMASREFQTNHSMFEILQSIRNLPSSLTQIDVLPTFQYEQLLAKLKAVTQYKEVVARHNRFNEQAHYINNQYEKLRFYKSSNKEEGIRIMQLYNFANLATRDGYHNVSNHLQRFMETIIPTAHRYRGLFRYYSKYMKNMEQKNDWCGYGQSINHFIYNSFQYTLAIIRKGYAITQQSYAIRNTLDEGHFKAEIRFVKRAYESTTKRIAKHFQRLANGASTRVVPCDPSSPIMNETYLEMEKFLQGFFPETIVLNEDNSPSERCEYYGHHGTGYYPYGGLRSDGDWKCHGIVYNCFTIHYAIAMCKPTIPSRRVNGVFSVRCTWRGNSAYCEDEERHFFMGNIGNCNVRTNSWQINHWLNYKPWQPIFLPWTSQCGCICDDINHPRTLRTFSREYAMSDFKNNMVVTGIRLVNISNIIHIRIQEGKLEEFGFIDPSTVHWREKNDVVTNDDGGGEIVRLSFNMRRVNLDVFHFESNDVVIGAAFDWDVKKEGVQLSVFATTFSFPTGELDQNFRQRLATNGPREEIVLKQPRLPKLCAKNIPVKGYNKFIKFQPTDWEKDAAQTLIPYLDIQPVVTNPPTMLRGIGFGYRNAIGCAGYIGLEVYSHEYENLIFYNDELY